MNTDLFALNELAAVAAPLLFFGGSLLVRGNLQRKLLLGGQMASFVFALAALVIAASWSLTEPVFLGSGWFSLRFDLTTSALLAAITFIAAVVTVFSERYLGGEKNRNEFLCGLSFLSSSSALLVASDNMCGAVALWHLLTWGLFCTMQVRDDDGAKKSAKTVLRHHLLSDLALFAAILVVYNSTGMLAFSDISKILPLLNSPFVLFGFATPVTAGMLVCLLLALSFSVKSGLFPFHRWLLATLDAPTPLSGLLHAGVVNVSAILAWRTMPLLQEYPSVLIGWGILSAISATVGTLSMSAQPDVKRKLVYSTVGQMGFMSLQCASGAVGAALFHLIAHGMFKCHMFLQSGSAVSEGVNKRKFGYDGLLPQARGGKTCAFITMAAIGSCVAVYFLCVNFGWTAFSSVVTAVALASALPALGRVDMKSLCVFWSAVMAIAIVSATVSSKFESLLHYASGPTAILMPLCLGVFATMALVLGMARSSRLAKSLYVHSLNGFYVDEFCMKRS